MVTIQSESPTSLPWPPVLQVCSSRQSRLPDDSPDRPPALAVDRLRGQTSGAILEASNCHLSSPDSVRSFLMFRRGSNPCECNVFILELKSNVHCASAANLHSRRTRMKQIWSPPCAHMMQPMRERVVRDWEDQPRYKTSGITTCH